MNLVDESVETFLSLDQRIQPCPKQAFYRKEERKINTRSMLIIPTYLPVSSEFDYPEGKNAVFV